MNRASKLYLVDASAFIHRAFHVFPSLQRSDGLQVNAVNGFCQMLWKLLREERREITHFAVVLDAPGKNFRYDIYPAYKANRPSKPPELKAQLGLIRDAVRAFGIHCIERQGYEADDILATCSRHAVKAGAEVVIVSSDKDLMQLIEPGVMMLDTMGGEYRFIGEPEVIEKFGVPPCRVVDVQSLMGDTVDNVPGVPGIGLKTAAELIRHHGDLEGVLSLALSKTMPGRIWALLAAHAEKARLSRQLVELDRYTPVSIPLNALEVQDPDPATLLGFLREMGFVVLTNRVERTLGAFA